jgi:hypothetical protein
MMVIGVGGGWKIKENERQDSQARQDEKIIIGWGPGDGRCIRMRLMAEKGAGGRRTSIYNEI